MFILNTMIYIIGINMYNAPRVAALFGPFVVIYLPRLISKGVRGQKKVLLCVFMFVLCVVQYIGRMMINNIGLTMPYIFFWNA